MTETPREPPAITYRGRDGRYEWLRDEAHRRSRRIGGPRVPMQQILDEAVDLLRSHAAEQQRQDAAEAHDEARDQRAYEKWLASQSPNPTAEETTP